MEDQLRYYVEPGRTGFMVCDREQVGGIVSFKGTREAAEYEAANLNATDQRDFSALDGPPVGEDE